MVVIYSVNRVGAFYQLFQALLSFISLQKLGKCFAPHSLEALKATASDREFQSSKSKIEIPVGISVFVVDSKLLLPTLGRSANLSEPWAPRKELSRR